MPKLNFYEVIVGNVGKVHEGNNRDNAVEVFNNYKDASIAGHGRAAHEAVTLYKNGEVYPAFDHVPDGDRLGISAPKRRTREAPKPVQVKKSILAMVEFSDKTVHKFFTALGTTPLRDADKWAAEQMKENPNKTCRVTFSEVLQSIEF